MKRLILLFLTLCLMLSVAVPAMAALEEENWEYIDTQKDLVIWVSWDVEQPTVVFIAPNGKVYDPAVSTDSTTTSVSTSTLYYTIRNAPAGQWRVRYDKGSNQQLEIAVQDYTPPLFIDSLTLGEILSNRMEVKFLVNAQEEMYYNYKLSAVADHTGVEKELYSGSGRTGEEVSAQVDLSKLSTYDGYMIKLYVWYNHNGADIFDFKFSDKFTFKNDSNDSQFQNFGLKVAPVDGLLKIAVTDLDWRAQSVMVAIFENGGAEPAMFDEYTVEEAKALELAYDPAATEVAVEVSVNYDGTFTTPVRKTFQPKKAAVTLPDVDAINSLTLPMRYTGLTKQKVDVQINGTHNELVLDGDGNVNITLGDDWNKLYVTYTDDQGIEWFLEREIFVDRVPPVLTMSRDYDGMTVQENKLSIGGKATDYHSVTINGQAVAVDADGLFSQELNLTTGANTVEVVAADKLGNESRYTAVIYYGVDAENFEQTQENKKAPGGLLEILTGPGSYWVMIIAGVLCLMVVGYALIFWRKEDKK